MHELDQVVEKVEVDQMSEPCKTKILIEGALVKPKKAMSTHLAKPSRTLGMSLKLGFFFSMLK